MALSDKDIQKEIRNKNIIVKPFSKKALQPASVDLRLDKEFMIFDKNAHHIIDVKKPAKDLMKKIIIKNNGSFILHPGDFALALVHEETGVSEKMVGRLEGKSSLGRLGLIIHTTAGYLDPGNSLKMTLELFNAGALPIKLYYKMPIAQMAFEYLSSPCERSYGDKKLNSKYYGDKGVQESLMHKNF